MDRPLTANFFRLPSISVDAEVSKADTSLSTEGSDGIRSFAAFSGSATIDLATAKPRIAHAELVNTSPGFAMIDSPVGRVAGMNATPENALGSKLT